MNTKKHILKKTILAAALSSALGVSTPVSATTISMSWSGAFTMLDPAGVPFNSSAPGAQTTSWNGNRIPISGTMTLDTATGGGSGYTSGFSFSSHGFTSLDPIIFQAIGDGMGGPGTLMLGNMVFNWRNFNGISGIPASIVLDAAGLFGALGSGTCGPSCVIEGVGVLADSENTLFGTGAASKSYLLPLGPIPVATTDWNTTDIGTVVLGTNPSGTLPLIADTVVDTRSCGAFGTSCTSVGTEVGIGGSPMKVGPFVGWNINFDIMSIHVTDISGVPIPTAFWLFGSGLISLISIARRKQSKAF